MAIFRKVDAALPIVTQLMQVDRYNEAEMLFFWRRCVALAYCADSKKRPRLIKSWKAIVSVQGKRKITDWAFVKSYELEAKEAGYKTPRAFLMANWRNTCRMASEVITRLYEKNEIMLGNLMRLREKSTDGKLQPTLAALDKAKPEPYGGEAFMPFKGFSTWSYFGVMVPDYYLSDELDKTLERLRAKKVRLSICHECESIFLQGKKQQKCCSDRCTNKHFKRKKAR